MTKTNYIQWNDDDDDDDDHHDDMRFVLDQHY